RCCTCAATSRPRDTTRSNRAPAPWQQSRCPCKPVRWFWPWEVSLLDRSFRRWFQRHVLLEKLLPCLDPARIGAVAHKRAVDHHFWFRMHIVRGIDSSRGTTRVDKADAMDRFALELTGKIDGVIVRRGLQHLGLVVPLGAQEPMRPAADPVKRHAAVIA